MVYYLPRFLNKPCYLGDKKDFNYLFNSARLNGLVFVGTDMEFFYLGANFFIEMETECGLKSFLFLTCFCCRRLTWISFISALVFFDRIGEFSHFSSCIMSVLLESRLTAMPLLFS